jgi:hypothetical protein
LITAAIQSIAFLAGEHQFTVNIQHIDQIKPQFVEKIAQIIGGVYG